MKQVPTSKQSMFSKKQIAAAIDAAPEHVIDPTCGYDPNDAEAVAQFWAKGKVQLPREPARPFKKKKSFIRYSVSRPPGIALSKARV